MTRAAAVIGAGVVGLATARALQREGFAVTVYDPVPPGASCSFGNAGIISVETVRPLSRPEILARVPRMLVDRESPLKIRWRDAAHLSPWLIRFAAACRAPQVTRGEEALGALMRAALPAWRRVLDEAGARDLLVERGGVKIYETATAFAADAGARATMRRLGVALEELDAQELHRRVPGLSPHIVGGVWLSEWAHVLDPHGLVLRLAEALRRDGGAIVAADVLGLGVADGRVVSLDVDGRPRPAGDWVAVCGGVRSPRLLRPLGVRAPIVAERGYHLMLEGVRAPFDIPIAAVERSFVMTPMAKGLRLAGTVEFGRETSPPDWYRAERLLRQASALVPGLAPGTVSRWMGQRPTQPDFLPSIGGVPGIGNLLVGFGHNHVGLTLAAATGLLLADIAAGRTPHVPLDALAVTRFSPRGQSRTALHAHAPRQA